MATLFRPSYHAGENYVFVWQFLTFSLFPSYLRTKHVIMRTILHAYAHLLSAVVLHDNFMFLKCNAINIKCTDYTPDTFIFASKNLGSLTFFWFAKLIIYFNVSYL